MSKNLYARRTLVNQTTRLVRILGKDEIAILCRYVIDRAKSDRGLVTLSVDTIGRPFVTTASGPRLALKVQSEHPDWHVGTYSATATMQQIAEDVAAHLEQLRSDCNVA